MQKIGKPLITSLHYHLNWDESVHMHIFCVDTLLLMLHWIADLCEQWAQPCRSWSRPGSLQCRCTRQSVRAGRWGPRENIPGRRIQMWSDCSQIEARHPVTDQLTVNIVWDIFFILSGSHFLAVKAHWDKKKSNIAPYTTECPCLVSLQPQQPDWTSPQHAHPHPPWWFQT